MDDILEVVDEHDAVVGQATRTEIHTRGLLHREIHVWLYTPKQEVFFQRRAKSKDTFPGFLDASVDGHVEIGERYETSALRELKEETGLVPERPRLRFLIKVRRDTQDANSGTQHRTFRAVFAYPFDGEISLLQVERGEAAGFERWPIDRLTQLTPEEKSTFVPMIVDEVSLSVFRTLTGS